jgi:uncharacterized membrane protein YdjX (TVP38/TMEM64 family)
MAYLRNHPGYYLFVGAIFIGLATLLLAALDHLLDLKEVMAEAGALSAILFVVGGIIAIVLLVPSTPLMIVGGILFGPIFGAILSLGAASTGAFVSFMISRHYGAGRLERWLKGHASKVYEYESKLAHNAFFTIFFMRMMPFVPKGPTNYFLGMSCVKVREYVLGTSLGLAPGAFAYAYVGDMLLNASPIEIAIILGAYAVFITTVVVVRRVIEHRGRSSERESGREEGAKK